MLLNYVAEFLVTRTTKDRSIFIEPKLLALFSMTIRTRMMNHALTSDVLVYKGFDREDSVVIHLCIQQVYKKKHVKRERKGYFLVFLWV